MPTRQSIHVVAEADDGLVVLCGNDDFADPRAGVTMRGEQNLLASERVPPEHPGHPLHSRGTDIHPLRRSQGDLPLTSRPHNGDRIPPRK
jgi:hypothetical protein